MQDVYSMGNNKHGYIINIAHSYGCKKITDLQSP